MAQITIEERGRNLVLNIGGELEYVVAPVPVEVGQLLLSLFLRIYTGQEGDLEKASADLAEMSLGGDLAERARGELRAEEYVDVINAAFYWQAHGGGIKVIQSYKDGGAPKAIETLFEAAGVQLTPLSTTSPNSASETPTP
ncbi:hypothetical protein [Mycetocola spongiae]|uniref:hypothetical protein n=1 Tax=Mycetocola spongiae TaxID=2859226 RepID=UPI001CF36564|nr:hypothetical protein [Mycetocola spongiae]UCR89246.1 hypothetical protein KXZ72_00590 [Mycetocola spongiae]